MRGWHLNPHLCRSRLCTAEHAQLSCYMRLLRGVAATPCSALSSPDSTQTSTDVSTPAWYRTIFRPPLWLFWALPNLVPAQTFLYVWSD